MTNNMRGPYMLLGILFVFGLFSQFNVYRLLGGIDAAVAELRVEQRAASVVQTFLNDDTARFAVHRTFCSDTKAPLCRAVSFQTYTDMGEKPTAFVVLDGGYALLKDELNTVPEREKLQAARLFIDLAVALSRYGAMPDVLKAAPAHTAQPYAIDYYTAMLAQAELCRVMAAEIGCENGLPTQTAQAFGQLVNLLNVAKATPPRHKPAAATLTAAGYEKPLRNPDDLLL